MGLAIVLGALLPIAVLIVALMDSSLLSASVDAWRGKFESPFLAGLPVNPWLDFLPTVLGFTAAYVLFGTIAAGIVRYVRPEAFLYRGRLPVGVVLVAAGSLALFGAIVTAAMAPNYFVNRSFLLIMYPPMPVILGMCMAVFVVNVVLLFRVRRRT